MLVLILVTLSGLSRSLIVALNDEALSNNIFVILKIWWGHPVEFVH